MKQSKRNGSSDQKAKLNEEIDLDLGVQLNMDLLNDLDINSNFKGASQTQQQQDKQLQQILNQTFTNTGYCDQDIGQFINDPSGNYKEIFRRPNSQILNTPLIGNAITLSNQSHRKQSESGSQGGPAYRQNFAHIEYSPEKSRRKQEPNYQQDQNNSELSKSSVKTSELSHHLDPYFLANPNNLQNLPKSFHRLDKLYQNHKKTHPLSEIKQKYPYFIISNPIYSLNKSYEQILFQYNTVRNLDIQAIDIGFCQIADNFRVAIGANAGKVAVFQKTYTKPVHIFEAFSVKKSKKQAQVVNSIKVRAIKWSQNMQYLGVSSQSRQLKVYQYKQSIVIQQNNILRMLKQPIQIISLSQKQLKNSIIQIRFVSQNPLVAILNDENDDMLILEYKLHIMNYRPYLSKLPIKFNDVFQVKLIDFVVAKYNPKGLKKNQKIFNNNPSDYTIVGKVNNKKGEEIKAQQEHGTLIAIGSSQYVTIALFKPYFQVMMVYDKQKHGKNIKKQGYSHISFRKDPLGILIIWDKFVHLLNIQIQSLNPLISKLNSCGSQLLPQTTLRGGLITDTLLYQVSQSGIKIYASTDLNQSASSSPQFHQPIYEHPINFFQLPSGIQIQDEMVNNSPSLTLVRLLESIIKVCNGHLFLTSNTSLFSVRIQKFEDFITNTIQNINNWKIGLQLLNDGYLGRYRNYDNMTRDVIVKNIHEYSTKYINFLQMVIGNSSNLKSSQSPTQNESVLWHQQTTFLFNILIQTQQFHHLYTKILPKLSYSNLGQYITSLQPFILLHKLPQLCPQGLSLIYEHIHNRQIISTLLIANIIPESNQIDLPHTLNQIILQNNMYEQIAALNVLFGDYFTVFAIIVGHYRGIDAQTHEKKQKNDMQVLLQLKLKLSNSSNSNKQESSQIQGQKQSQPGVKSQQITAKQNELYNLRSQQNKTRLRQLLIYFTYKVLSKINTGQDIPPNSCATQRKKMVNRHKQFLQTFIHLFQSSIIPILLDSPDQQSPLFELILPQMFTGQCLQLINHISNKQFNRDLMTQIVLGIPIERVTNLRLYWMCLIGLYNKSIIKIEVFMGLKYLVNWERQKMEEWKKEQEAMKSKSMEQSNFVQNEKNQHNKEYKAKKLLKSQKKFLKNTKNISVLATSNFIKQTINLSSNKISQQFRKLSNEILKQFYNQLLSPSLSFESSHIGLLRIIALILGPGYFIKVIHAIMVETEPIINHQWSQSTNKTEHKKIIKNPNHYTVYNFIQQSIFKYSKSQKEQLKIILQQNIQYFIQLDCDKLCSLIIQFYLDSIDKFVSYNGLESGSARGGHYHNYTGIVIGNNNNFLHSNSNNMSVHEHLLIRLIQGLINKIQQPQIQIMRIQKFQPHSEWMLNLRLKYLQLLAVTGRQHQILSEVKKQKYPLDSSLDICRKYGVIDAEAYLLVKSGGQGQIASAIKLYFSLINQKIKLLTPQSMNQFKDYFISIMKECIRVCESLHSAIDHFNEQWFMISQELCQLKTNIYRILPAYTCDLFYDIVEREVYPILSQKMVRKQHSDGIIEYLRLNMQYEDLSFVRSLLHQILKNNAFQKIMFLLTQQSYITSQIKQRELIRQLSSKGFVSTCTCFICHEQNGLVIHYRNCGHQIHPSCGQDVKMCVICGCRQQKMIQRQLDIIKKIKPQLYGEQNELIILPDYQQKLKVKKETKIEKLKKFDETRVDVDYI